MAACDCMAAWCPICMGRDPRGVFKLGANAEPIKGGVNSSAEDNVTYLKSRLYEAKTFTAQTAAGVFSASGTLCGHIDFVGPFRGTYILSPHEISNLIIILQRAKEDVLINSDPLHDPRLTG